MTEAEREAHSAESLFLNTVTYENERLGAYMLLIGRVGDGASADGAHSPRGSRALAVEHWFLRRPVAAALIRMLRAVRRCADLHAARDLTGADGARGPPERRRRLLR